ncbi:hypothetical protein C8R46DRAFT_1206380 [Mycena filopes]|nr:hypothetical protein C8R46DRAFT_1206380 [Mycena filopes]
MVLTRRQYRAISRWLPNEIITEVITASPKADQAVLTRVSKLFYGLATPVLYKAVDLRTLAKINGFCSSILVNASLSQPVRVLKLGNLAVREASFSQRLLRALKTLSFLEHIVFVPSLLLSDDLDTFLRSAPTHMAIAALFLHPPSTPDLPSFLPYIETKNLSKVDLVCDIPLECCIYWTHHYLGEILTENMVTIKRCLPRFTNLVFLSVEDMLVGRVPTSSFWTNEVQDGSRVGGTCARRWKPAVCPWWKLGSGWEKCPLEEFRVLGGAGTT